MTIGIVAGILLRGIKNFNIFSERATSYIIYLLLFFMGLGVGTNRDVMTNISSIGWQSLVITLFSILGSVLCAAIIFNYFFKNES